MPTYNMNQAKATNMSNVIEDFSIDPMDTDGATDQKETEYTNPDWSQYWGYFNSVPDLKSAILMKAIWDVGKGWTADAGTEARLNRIDGWGKDTFDDILFNMEVIMRVNGDAYAEIIRNEAGTLINLKPLDPGTIKIVVDGKGIILRYEQTAKTGEKKTLNKWRPQDIFHISNNRLADQIHGISDIKALEQTILANEESFADTKKMMHHQGKPFILWKLKTDDPAKVANAVTNIDNARNLSEDLIIPDDDDAISHEVIEIKLSQMVLSWRDDIRNKFYRTIMLPQVVPGASGQGTESNEKVIIFAFEQLVERDQRFLEKQIFAQLGETIDLIHPASIKPEMQKDEAKDAQQGLNFQKGETTAGVG